MTPTTLVTRVTPIGREGALFDVVERQARGKMWIWAPQVWSIAYGPKAVERATRTYVLMQTPGNWWNDDTYTLRLSVKMPTPTTVVYGSAKAFYAPYVEASRGGMRKSYIAALREIGYR